MARLDFVMLVVVLLIGTSNGRIATRADILVELDELGVPGNELPDFLCMLGGVSEVNTSAKVGSEDGSVDYGLFSINNRYWCGEFGVGGRCNMSCSNLVDDDISDDVVCVHTIFNTENLDNMGRNCTNQILPDFLI